MKLAQTLQPRHLITLLKLFKANDAFLRLAAADVEAVFFGRVVDEHAGGMVLWAVGQGICGRCAG